MFRRFTRAASAVVVTALAGASVLVSAGCASPSAPSTPVEFTVIDLRVGSGAAASTGSTVSVNYVGWLYDGTNQEKKGTEFDASKPGRPFVFWLGAGAFRAVVRSASAVACAFAETSCLSCHFE